MDPRNKNNVDWDTYKAAINKSHYNTKRRTVKQATGHMGVGKKCYYGKNKKTTYALDAKNQKTAPMF